MFDNVNNELVLCINDDYKNIYTYLISKSCIKFDCSIDWEKRINKINIDNNYVEKRKNLS